MLVALVHVKSEEPDEVRSQGNQRVGQCVPPIGDLINVV